jgi:uncharacterized protein
VSHDVGRAESDVQVDMTLESPPVTSPTFQVAKVGVDDVPIELALLTADGVQLRGRLRASHRARATVVLAHGFSASCEDKSVCELADDLFREGLDVLTYDARGHGGSEGHCGVGSTEHLDVKCAVERACESGLPVVLIGISMGAVAVVNYLATEPIAAARVAGAVLVSAPAKWRMRVSAVGILTAALTQTRLGRYIAARRLGVRVARRWRVGEPPQSAVRRISLPLAIVHGTGDRLLAVVHGRQLHESAGGPSRLDVVSGMGHGVDDPCRKVAVDSVRWILDLKTSSSRS